VELQENALEPNVVVSFDFRSRYQLAQLRVSNRGGSPAYDVLLDWHTALKNSKGENLEPFGSSGVLPILSAKDAATILLGQSRDFLSSNPQHEWSGAISYRLGNGATGNLPFRLSAEHERSALLHTEEEPRTHYELQQIPERLKTIATEISSVRKLLGG
jgi:hypothetical protein